MRARTAAVINNERRRSSRMCVADSGAVATSAVAGGALGVVFVFAT